MTAIPIERLIFIFDANAGKFGAFVDSVKKVLMLNGCPLCALTHGIAGEKAEWKLCKESLGVPVDYVHRDEVSPRLKAVAGAALPCILAEAHKEIVLLVGPEALEHFKGSITDFRGRLRYLAATKGLSLSDEAT